MSTPNENRMKPRKAQANQPRPWASACLLYAALLIGTTAHAITPGEGAPEARLTRLIESMTTFRATFEQVVSGPRRLTGETLTGSVLIETPGKLRWEVFEPYPQLLVADGERLWVFDPDLEQVSVQPLSEVTDGSLPFLIRGMDDIRDLTERYVVREPRPMIFRLSPKGDATMFRELTMQFDDGRLTRIQIDDHLDAVTSIRFDEVVVGEAIDPAQFRFDVPEGVDLIEGNLIAPEAP